jgi:hypothetical protein
MSRDPVAKKWRKYFVNKLQEQYGLAADDARRKADLWMRWLKELPSPQAENQTTAMGRDEHAR